METDNRAMSGSIPGSFFLWSKKEITMKNQRVLLLVEIAIFAALGYVLDMIGFGMPQGGYCYLCTCPCYFNRVSPWNSGRFSYWIINWIITSSYRSFLCSTTYLLRLLSYKLAIDYFIAFMVAGFAGLLRPAFMKAYEQKDKMKMALWQLLWEHLLQRFFVI